MEALDEPRNTELFPCELNRWVMLAGTIASALAAAVFAFVAALRSSWAAVLILGVFMALALFAAVKSFAAFRHPRRYSVEITSQGIRQPSAPGCPSLAWNEVTRINSAAWGGFWLTDDAGSRRVRVWDEVPRFVEVLDVVLERGSFPPPAVPLVVTRPRWHVVVSLVSLAVLVALLGWFLVERGPTRLFWFSVVVFGWAFYDDWRRRGRALQRVEIGPHAITLTSRSGEVVIPLGSVVDVRLLPWRSGLSTILVREDGEATEVPCVRQRDAYRVYQALSQRCVPRELASSEGRTVEFAATRRRQVLAVIVGGAIAGLSSAAARSCGRTRSTRRSSKN